MLEKPFCVQLPPATMDIDSEIFRAICFDFNIGLAEHDCLGRLRTAFKARAPSPEIVSYWFSQFRRGRSRSRDGKTEPPDTSRTERLPMVENILGESPHMICYQSDWGTVRMKNSRVRDWEGFGRTLSSSGTRNLDLRKMLLPDTPEATVEMWNELTKAIAKVTSLRRIDLGRCTPEAVESVASSCPQLESITSLAVRGGELDMTPLSTCTNLTELRLKTIGGIDVKNLTSLKSLTELKHLSLTTVKNLAGIEEVLSEKLESLELGECATLSEEAATEALGRLTSLRRLRLEKGQGSTCPVTSLLTTVASLPALTQLELINFDVKPGFDKALAKCSNLKTLLIIPTYVTQSATTNHVVMGGVSKLSSTLTYFVWGLTLELLRVTDLFIDQVEGQKGKAQAPGPKKGTGDSIPILKPMVEDGAGGNGGEGANSASQVDILALPKLQKVLSTLLPTTKIKILKVPFSATWRQTVSEVPQ